ncbi:MAG TPA: heme-binding protein [Steroidobacteraceae bacterium]|nr:heme-binding protein [Steroidobacteraceae bacterium]
MPGNELTIEVRTMSAAGSKLALAAAERAAAEKALKVSIAIVDNAGNLVAFQRLDGACVTSIEAATRKARTAVHLGAPTKVFEDLLHGGMTSLLAFEFISPSQGGVPVMLDGALIGGIGSSGASGDEDEMVANAGAAAILAAAAQHAAGD